jgi:hypothetical protein
MKKWFKGLCQEKENSGGPPPDIYTIYWGKNENSTNSSTSRQQLW